MKVGTGLVWYGTTGKGADYEALVGSVDETAREEVFCGYPADVFPIAFDRKVLTTTSLVSRP